MAQLNTFILFILWMIIIMIGTSNTGNFNTISSHYYPISMLIDNVDFFFLENDSFSTTPIKQDHPALRQDCVSSSLVTFSISIFYPSNFSPDERFNWNLHRYWRRHGETYIRCGWLMSQYSLKGGKGWFLCDFIVVEISTHTRLHLTFIVHRCEFYFVLVSQCVSLRYRSTHFCFIFACPTRLCTHLPFMSWQ